MLETAVRALVVLEVTGKDGVSGEKEAKREARGHRGDPWKEREMRNMGSVMKAKEGVSEVQAGTRQ